MSRCMFGLASLLLVIVICGCSEETAPVTTGSISGKVLVGQELLPVAGAVVTTQPPTSSVLTDSLGRYGLPSVASGTYFVNAQRQGVGSGTASVSVRAGETTDAVIVINGTVPRQDLPAVTDGLAVFFPLDNSAQVLVGDSLVSANVLLGAEATTDRKDRQGKATRFLGAETSYLTAMFNPTLQRIPLTISFWLRKDVAPRSLETILSKYLHPSGEGIHLVYENQKFTAAYMAGGFTNYSRADAQHPPLNQWVHIAFVCSPANCSLYVDGELQKVAGWNNGSSTNTVTSEPFSIGYTRSTTAGGTKLDPLNGSIDDLAWYGRVLTSSEIKKLAEDR